MEATTFRPGDRVRCVYSRNNLHDLVLDDLYTVRSVSELTGNVSLLETPSDHYHHRSRFELAEPRGAWGQDLSPVMNTPLVPVPVGVEQYALSPGERFALQSVAAVGKGKLTASNKRNNAIDPDALAIITLDRLNKERDAAQRLVVSLHEDKQALLSERNEARDALTKAHEEIAALKVANYEYGKRVEQRDASVAWAIRRGR